MKSFKNYCDEEFSDIKMSKKQNNIIRDNCASKKLSNSIFKYCLSPHSLKRLVLSCLCIGFAIAGIKIPLHNNNIKTVGNKPIVTLDYPTEHSSIINQTKIKLPTGKKTVWNYDEVCSYFGKNIGLNHIPEKLEMTTLRNPKIVYLNPDNEVIFDNIEFTYQENNSLEDRAYLNFLISKGKMPIVDEVFTGTTDSSIGSTKIKICKINSTKFRLEFMYDDVGYIITTSHLSKDTISDILCDLIK